MSGDDELLRRGTRRLMAAQTAAFAASGVAVGLAPSALGGTHGTAGAMLAALGMAAGAGAFAGGRLIDRGDARRRLAAAHALYALAGLAAAAAAAAGSPGLLLAAAALAGAGQGAALLGRVVSAAMHTACRRGRELGRMLTLGALGAAAGPLVASAAQDAAGALGLDPRALPWLALPALGALGAAASLAVEREALSPPPRTRRPAAPGDRPPGFPLAALALAAAQVAMVAVMALAPLAVLGHTGSEAAMALAIAAHQLGMYGLGAPIGRLLDRAGPLRGLGLGGLATAAGAALALAPVPPAGAVAGLVVVGAGWSAVYVAATAVIGSAGARARAGAMGGADLLAAAAGAAAALGSEMAAAAAGEAVVGLAVAVPLAALVWAALAAPPLRGGPERAL
jgi:CP family cyanate transporter-like MFS transporter